MSGAGRLQRRRLTGRLIALACVAVLGLTACGGGGSSEDQPTVGLIIKQDENPFFVKIRDAAQDAADDSDVELLTAAGESDADNQSQVEALEEMTARGAEGIMITPADSAAVVPAIEEARRAGVTVVALDTPTDPRSAVDALFATDNRRAGELIGRYAKAKAEQQGIEPKIAMLDLGPGGASGQLRHDGFLEGFGIEEGAPQIVGSVDTQGDRQQARAGMEQLLRQNPDINVVYTVNEPAAFGAWEALEAAGKSEDDVILVSVDGGCEAIKDGVRPGIIDATAQQYPENMATEGLEAILRSARGGPSPSGFGNTGVELITADPVAGVEARNEAFGVRNCWG